MGTTPGRNPQIRQIGAGALLFGVTLAAYGPALAGDMLWDDAAHVTAPALRSLEGLRRIWFEPGSTQQYYPLLHTAFWVEHRLWGDALLGYHLADVLLHATAACLLVAILRRLHFAPAWLAGFLFALHPVAVEAVAWISEQKSTLSAVFYLASALLYLDFDRTRRNSRYWPALALFVCALATKTVTATLPAALLLIFWWRRGRLDWRRDAWPLLPWLALSAAAGSVTAWVERRYIGAVGNDFALGPTARCLVAGRALWFYLGKLLWPVNLMFTYPRWIIDPAVWWQYLFPAAAVVMGAALWLLARRRRYRGPLASCLFFAGTLFPALGFFNVYPFVFSWVADHFQYLASVGILVPAAWGLPKLPTRVPAFVVLAAVALLTWRQSHIYRDAETLYRTTIARNPDAWMAHNNLGLVLEDRSGGLPEAIRHFETVLRLKPGLAEAHLNLGSALSRAPGRLAEAIALYKEALALEPGSAMAHADLGIALAKMPGRTAEALAQLEEAVRLKPDYAEPHFYLGSVLEEMPGRRPEAIAEYETALRLKPDYAAAEVNLGAALQAVAGRETEALDHFEAAARLNPGLAAAHFNLANALVRLPGRLPDAIAEYETTVRLAPDDAAAHANLGAALSRIPRRAPEAVTHLETAIRLRPDDADPHYNLANVLSEIPGRVPDAVAEYRAALRIRPGYAEAHANLGNALADQPGRLGEAMAEEQAALRLNPRLAEAHANLGMVLAKAGRLPEAIAQFETALQIKPDYEPARQVLEQLRSAARRR